MSTTADKRFHRPPFILAHPADLAGCGFHRIIRPLEIMSRQGLAAGRFDQMGWMPQQLQMLLPDIIVWQRQVKPEQIAMIRRDRDTLPRATIVYEIDDAMDQVPAWSYHRAFIPSDIASGMVEAALACDIITVTTDRMADYMREKCGDGADVRIIANMLGADDFARAQEAKAKAHRFHRKPRVGWGGGLSHKGDLDLLLPVMKALQNKVTWVFIGSKPDTTVPFQFYEGVAPQDYLPALAGLDLDLMVAPLVDCTFNQCKSNLRLIEGGACSYPVIASAVHPYFTDTPPVFGHAGSTEEWIAKIEEFIGLEPEQWQRHGESMRNWAQRNYNMDERAEERIKAWLPRDVKPFRRRKRSDPGTALTIVCPFPTPEMRKLGRVIKSFEEAPHSSGDLLYIRGGTEITEQQIDRLRARLVDGVGSVTPLSNDGGLAGFPRINQFQMIQAHVAELDMLCRNIMAETEANLPYPSGPAVLMSRRAIDNCGLPLFGTAGTEEAALLDWGYMVAARGFQHKAAPDVYVATIMPAAPIDMNQRLQAAAMRFPKPNVAADPLMEVRLRLDLSFHREFYRTPLPTQSNDGAYGQWTAYFDTPGDLDLTAMRLSAETMKAKPRFGVVMGNGAYDIQPQTWDNWSKIVGVKDLDEVYWAAREANCDWVLFLREGGTLRSHALYMLALEIMGHAEQVYLIYADHDHIDRNGARTGHDFKPNFDLEMLIGRDYVTPIFVVDVGALDYKLALSEPNLYALALDLGLRLRPDQIRHVPRILAHVPVRSLADEKKMMAQKAALAEALVQDNGLQMKVRPHPKGFPYALARYEAPDHEPLVSIIIPTKDNVIMLEPCINTLLAITDYPHFEIIIIDHESVADRTVAYLSDLTARESRIGVIQAEGEFNWAALNNRAAKTAEGELLLFLNDDVEILEPGWLREMVGCASRQNVGAVGARLLYPHGAVQHVGVTANNGKCGHIHKSLPVHHPGYNGIAVINHEATAVTGACLMTKASVFQSIGGFSEMLAHNFNDVAYCLEVRKAGYKVISLASAQLHHHESVSRPKTFTEEGMERLRREGAILAAAYPDPDPYWNPNLQVLHSMGGAMVQGLNFEQLAWPGEPWPWRDDEWPMERVMILGDDGLLSAAEIRDGNPVFRAVVDGFRLMIALPPLENTPAFDIRAPRVASPFIRQLGIDRVVLGSLVGMPLELLSFLTAIGIPVQYRANNGEAVCPMTDFTRAGKSCERGWARDECQFCVDQHGCSFGQVSVIGYRDTWRRFLAAAALSPDAGLSNELEESIKYFYGDK